jgi:hypothetical protein
MAPGDGKRRAQTRSGRTTMNLLISEMSTADAMLDRAIPWTESMFDSPGSLPLDDESHEHPGRVVSSAAPAWYDLRLSVLRQAILDAF